MSKKLGKIRIDSSFSLTQQDLFLRSMGFSKIGVDTYLEDYGPIWKVKEEDGQKYLAVFTNDEGDIIRQALKGKMKKTAQGLDETDFWRIIERSNGIPSEIEKILSEQPLAIRKQFRDMFNAKADAIIGVGWDVETIEEEEEVGSDTIDYITIGIVAAGKSTYTDALSSLKREDSVLFDYEDYKNEEFAYAIDRTIEASKQKKIAQEYEGWENTKCPTCGAIWDMETTIESEDEQENVGVFPKCQECGNRISDIALYWAPEKIAQDERREGFPKTDVERVMCHYNISEEDAKEMIESTPVEKLLPEKGTGLKEASKKTADEEEFEVIVVKSDKGYHLMNPHSMYYKGEMTKDILKGLDWTDNLEEAFIFVTEDDARVFADQQGLVTRASKKTAVDIYHAEVEPKYIEMAMDELRYGPEWSFESLSDEQQDTVIDRAKKIKEFKEKTSKKIAQIEEHDLKVLKGISDEELYNEIKKRQPKWSDEAIKEEIKRLRDPEFAEWYRDLFERVREKEGGLSKTAEMSTEEMKEFEERAIESLEKKISEIRVALQKDNIITVQWLFGSLAEIAKDCANELREKGGLGVWASLWNDRRLRPQSLKKKGKWLK